MTDSSPALLPAIYESFAANLTHSGSLNNFVGRERLQTLEVDIDVCEVAHGSVNADCVWLGCSIVSVRVEELVECRLGGRRDGIRAATTEEPEGCESANAI